MREEGEMFGLIAEFDNAPALLEAARKANAAGYRKMDAYSPLPVEGLSEAIGFKGSRLALIVFFGGLIGAVAGFGLQAFASVIDYPWNVGGRPLLSWPSFIPVTFELAILFASLAAVFGMMALNGLPMPYHPVFNAPNFESASRDRFFLCIEARDPKFDAEEARRFLESVDPLEVSEVDP